MKRFPPLKSVRRYCLWCMNGQAREVSLCPSDDCPFYPLRFGKRKQGMSTLKMIKAKCKDCAESVKKCDFIDCQIYPYRFGHNPARQGIGGSSPFLFKKRS